MMSRIILGVVALTMIGCQGEVLEETTPTATQAQTPADTATPTPSPTPSPTEADLPLEYIDRASLTLTTFTGSIEDDQAGQSFTTGDFNGDGTIDFAIGADNFFSEAVGQVYIVFGPVEGDVDLTEADIILTGEVEGDTFGVSVLNLGDLNSDGIDDLAVGADQWALEEGGKVYIFDSPHGSRAASTADGIIQVSESWDGLGLELFRVNNLAQGYSGGLLVTSGGADAERNGEIHIFPLDKRGDITQADAIVHVYHSDENTLIGHDTEVLADMNGDGIEDLVTTLEYDGGATAGALVLYGPLEGSHDLANADAVISVPAQKEELLNYAVLGSGDLDQNGNTDLLMSIPYYAQDPEDLDTIDGLISIYEGSLSGDVSQDSANTTFYGPKGSALGGSMDSTNDLDGQGLAEIITISQSYPMGALYSLSALDGGTPEIRGAFGEVGDLSNTPYYFKVKMLPDLDGQGRPEVGLTIFTPASDDPSRLVILSGERLHALLTDPPTDTSDTLKRPLLMDQSPRNHIEMGRRIR